MTEGLLRIQVGSSKPEPTFLKVPVTIDDSRQNFGRVDLLVRPYNLAPQIGGTAWVSAERVEPWGD